MRLGVVAIQMLVLVVPLRAADPLAAFVGSDALAQLRAGSVIKTGLAQDATLSLAPNVTSRDTISSEVKALVPSVGAEFLKIIPGPGGAMEEPAASSSSSIQCMR